MTATLVARSQIEPGLRPVVGLTLLTANSAALFGRIDARTVGAVRPELQRWVDAQVGELILDVSQAEIPDSWGLGMLVGVHRRARIHGQTLVLLDVPPRLGWLIRHTRLHRVLVCRSTHPQPGLLAL